MYVAVSSKRCDARIFTDDKVKLARGLDPEASRRSVDLLRLRIRRPLGETRPRRCLLRLDVVLLRLNRSKVRVCVGNRIKPRVLYDRDGCLEELHSEVACASAS